MDRRSWPWKRKSSDKSAADKSIVDKATPTLDSAPAVSLPSEGSQTDKDNYKKPNYVQISVESYSHLTGLEDQLKTYEGQLKTYEDQLKTLDEQIDELNEKLSAAHTEMTNKDELVKQHGKVAEEAVSGWEAAEAETAALKTHLEAVTLSKLTAEDRAAHLDGALKECMRQIRNLKEEHEQKVQDVVMTKNVQHDKLKREFESKLAEMDRQLLRAEAENDSLSRSLQERSSMLIKMTEEKSQAEAEIEHLKSNIETCEREINSLKYELHIINKELEIRNEEKNMSAKSAEVANRQHMEGVKKIAKLEAECQRLRGLVRKKLPGPAALAQMKIEVDSLGRDYGETRRRSSPSRPASPLMSPHLHMSPVTEFTLDASQKSQKENEYLTERLFAMEEEMKMLKEALAKRNNELLTSRTMSAKTANKLQSLEAQLQILSKSKPSTDRPSIQSPSMASLSEDGNDDAASVAESWASVLVSDLSNAKDKNKDRSSRTDGTNHLELMDDFLEMEKLARLSNDSNGGVSITTENKQPEAENTLLDEDHPSPLMKVKLRIMNVFESMSNDADMAKILEEIKHIVQETQDSLHPRPVSCIYVEKHCSEDAVVSTNKEVSLLENGVQDEKLQIKEIEAAISEIHAFVLSLGKEAAVYQGTSDDENGLNRKVEVFSTSCSKALRNEMSLADFIVSLSDIMSKVSDLSFNFVGYKRCEMEANCIDKVALPENKEAQADRYPNGCSHVSDSSSNPEVPSLTGFGTTASCKCSMEEFEQSKEERDNMERELGRSLEELKTTKCQLKDTEQLLAQVRSELAFSEKTNSLAETQLKCMAESYKSLEKRAEELESEVNILQTKVESLDIELQSEKANHQDALVRCKDLEEQLNRNEECSVCTSMAAELENKSKQEKELEAAAAKLAECQETISLLGRQLNVLRPVQIDVEEEEAPSSTAHARVSTDQAEMDPTPYNAPSSPAHTSRTAMSLRSPKHRRTKSGSSSASSNPTPEKHTRGFTRFFSSKGTNRR